MESSLGEIDDVGLL